MRGVLIILLLFLIVGTGIKPSVGLTTRLELNITETEKFGKVTAISVFIENHTGGKIYLDGLVPPRVFVYKEHNGKFFDFSHSWGELEIYQENRDTIAAANQQTFYVNNKTYDVLTDKLMDTDVKAFYNKLKEDNPSIDSTAVKKWVVLQFESLLNLNPGQVYNFIYGINSLEKGSYKIWFSYSNKDGYARYMNPKEKFESLQLPKTIDGFTRWRGEIKSDTLYLNIR